MNYQETIQFLYDRLPVFHLLGATAYKPGFENTLRLMELLDHPHRKFKTIHVAGTNGKGSVSHYMAAILQQAGYKVGLYTSPHLVDFRERIRIDGVMIEEQYVVDFIASHREAIETIQPSFFELTMSMAFDYYADQHVDIAVIEVGLGGRLDSTNIILPELSIITNIGFDHVEFLGDTLVKIATEKAGIIKQHVPVVVGETVPETKEVFVRKAAEMQSDIAFASEVKHLEFKEFSNGKMVFEVDRQPFISGLSGVYQLKNIATALTAVDQLNKINIQIEAAAIKSGIENVCEITSLRGRWELVQQHPTIIADTGHNAHGIQQVVNQLAYQSYKNLRIIIGMVNDKDIEGVLSILPNAAVYYFTQAHTQRALSADELKQKALKHDLQGNSYATIPAAINMAIAESDSDDLILITGSNFVVGEALTFCHCNKPHAHLASAACK